MYGTVAGGDTYFSTRLHTDAWDNASPADKTKALTSASQAIDALAFTGYKHTVWLLFQDTDCPEDADIDAAHVSQLAQFPRGRDTVVPTDIDNAAYEESLALLGGTDPFDALSNFGIQSEAFAGVSVTYSHTTAPPHLANGIASARAWQYLSRFLRNLAGVQINRV